MKRFEILHYGYNGEELVCVSIRGGSGSFIHVDEWAATDRRQAEGVALAILDRPFKPQPADGKRGKRMVCFVAPRPVVGG